MTRVFIDMPVYRTYGGFCESIRVELVDLAPHITNATWAVGRNSDYPSLWRCYNVETGQACGKVNDAPTKRACVNRVRRFLARQSNRSVEERYQIWAKHRHALGGRS